MSDGDPWIVSGVQLSSQLRLCLSSYSYDPGLPALPAHGRSAGCLVPDSMGVDAPSRIRTRGGITHTYIRPLM
jgi:hypothetical protein